MKEDFNIDDLKKEMPYKVPESFFESITEKTLNEAKKRKKIFHFSQWKIVTVSVAASLLLLFGIRIFSIKEQSLNNITASQTTVFEDAIQQIYSEYSSEITDILQYTTDNNNANSSDNSIDQILSEIPDEELNTIFSDNESDIFYAKL